jgi:capsular polysaccharide export protein
MDHHRSPILMSRGIKRIPLLDCHLDPVLAGNLSFAAAIGPLPLVGWGRKASGEKAIAGAARRGSRFWLLEDGFVRSWSTGDHDPPLSLVVDGSGIYYDSRTSCDLEDLLNSTQPLILLANSRLARARQLLMVAEVSKYNQAPPLESLPRLAALLPSLSPQPASMPARRVLVVDQTCGDLSVVYGGATAATFAAMVEAALAENPQAEIWLKTHPEVSSGRKQGYLTAMQPTDRLKIIREQVNPIGLLKRMDRVYVVTSTIGFEALLLGKQVTCFGRPWYGGWGVTDDRQPMARRMRQRTIDELFVAAYGIYASYVNPDRQQRGDLLHLVEWILRQRACRARLPTAWRVVSGWQFWRRDHLRPILTTAAGGVTFHRTWAAAMARVGAEGGAILCWGSDLPAVATTQSAAVNHYRIEDGFYRSVGLGSDLVRPASWVIDRCGLYFDVRQASQLEQILNEYPFESDEAIPLMAQAEALIEAIVTLQVTKYNTESLQPPRWPSAGRRVVLVPGQVENDASIRYGGGDIVTNLALLRAVREAEPEAFIVYKPHPDVTWGGGPERLVQCSLMLWSIGLNVTAP